MGLSTWVVVLVNVQFFDKYSGTFSFDYVPLEFKSPVLSGTFLTLFGKVSKFWPLNQAVFGKLSTDSKFPTVSSFASTLDLPPTIYPLKYPEIKGEKKETVFNFEPTSLPIVGKGNSFQFNSITSFALAYRSNKLTPTDVIRNVLKAVENSDKLSPPLRSVIFVNAEDAYNQAKASTERFKQGKPLSILDGVPFSVKDECDVKDYKTYCGTKFFGDLNGIKSHDATCVHRLRQLGAIVIGKTNMYELGLGTTGANYHYGMPRNPYNVSHYTGGSSAGSGNCVGSGITPFAIGADGGGSIRIPSAFNGIVGIKATFGRISEHGAFPLCHSLGHLGPMANCVRDAAITYLALQGQDEHDQNSQAQPYNDFQMEDLETLKLSDLKIGIYQDWNKDAIPIVQRSVESIVSQLKSLGASTHDITLPYMSAMKLAHTVTIGSEIYANVEKYFLDPNFYEQFSTEVKITLGFMGYLKYADYQNAQKIRTYYMNLIDKVFEQVDVIITPATPMAAPFIKPESIENGISDLNVTGAIMAFQQLGNFVGIPAIVVPINYDLNGLPIAIQIYAKHWNEKVLFQVANHIEKLVIKKKPSVYFDVLNP